MLGGGVELEQLAGARHDRVRRVARSSARPRGGKMLWPPASDAGWTTLKGSGVTLRRSAAEGFAAAVMLAFGLRPHALPLDACPLSARPGLHLVPRVHTTCGCPGTRCRYVGVEPCHSESSLSLMGSPVNWISWPAPSTTARDAPIWRARSLQMASKPGS